MDFLIMGVIGALLLGVYSIWSRNKYLSKITNAVDSSNGDGLDKCREEDLCQRINKVDSVLALMYIVREVGEEQKTLNRSEEDALLRKLERFEARLAISDWSLVQHIAEPDGELFVYAGNSMYQREAYS